MKTPESTQVVSSITRQGAEVIAAGKWPVKKNTVTADVLARLLTGERLTGLDSVYEASTTRLGGVAFYLAKDCGWRIESIDKAAGCRDDRMGWVSEYFLPVEGIVRAMAAGAGMRCAEVRAARNKLRAYAAHAPRGASRANAASRARRHHSAQWGLFEVSSL